MSKRSRLVIPVVLAFLVACAGSGVYQAEREIDEGNLDAAVEKLEKLVAEDPDDFDAQMALGRAYYRQAREADESADQEKYADRIGKAQAAFVEAVRIKPEHPSPHTWMGIALAYRNDLKSATTSFENARRLDPRYPVHYTNLAQIMIYRGKLTRARSLLDKGRRYGAPPAILELNQTLFEWRTGNLDEAKDVFDTALSLDPEFVASWDEAPVSDPIESFDDFTDYCCSNPACGPYMVKACKRLDLTVSRRELDAEVARKELLQEMERRRRLEKIYKKRGDLKIEVDKAEPVEGEEAPR